MKHVRLTQHTDTETTFKSDTGILRDQKNKRLISAPDARFPPKISGRSSSEQTRENEKKESA
jgi:hypothetical protein